MKLPNFMPISPQYSDWNVQSVQNCPCARDDSAAHCAHHTAIAATIANKLRGVCGEMT
jgi:hypothetical protein